jgi:hypothetical protein
MKQMTENALVCRYTNWQSAEVLVLDEPSRMESAILGLLRMVPCWGEIGWDAGCSALNRISGFVSMHSHISIFCCSTISTQAENLPLLSLSINLVCVCSIRMIR